MTRIRSRIENLRALLAAFIVMTLVPIAANAEDVGFRAPAGSRPHLRVELYWGRIEISTHKENFARIEVKGEPSPNGLRTLNAPHLDTTADAGRISVLQPAPEKGKFRSAVVEVLVPETCNLELVMLRGGDIDVRDVEGEISITNLNGSVAMHNVAGAALVNASNGAIQASFRKVDEELDLQFVTFNGSVELCMPDGFQANVALFTEGDPILSDFTVKPATDSAPEAQLPERRGSEEVTGEIGDSERWLVASTLNGEIRLVRCRR